MASNCEWPDCKSLDPVVNGACIQHRRWALGIILTTGILERIEALGRTDAGAVASVLNVLTLSAAEAEASVAQLSWGGRALEKQERKEQGAAARLAVDLLQRLAEVSR